jgi:hypothetical protein
MPRHLSGSTVDVGEGKQFEEKGLFLSRAAWDWCLQQVTVSCTRGVV